MSATLWARAEKLLACAVTQLEAVGAPVPDRRFIAPGLEVAWDDCCDGQLWVRIIKVHPVNPFPTKVLATVPCPYPMGANLGLGILRCGSGLGQLDQPEAAPTIADLTGDARQMTCDMAALSAAIDCCYDRIGDGETTSDQWSPLGPGGGCYGGEWTLWIDVDLTCPEEAP